MENIERRLKNKLDEVYTVEPNSLGNTYLTTLFKQLTSFLKVMPFIYIIPLSFGITVLLYLTFGTLTIKLASLLQYGF